MSPRIPTRAALAALVAVLIGGFSATARAQETGRIQGTVTAAGTGAPLSGAQVYVQGTSIGIVTNAEGRFLLLNVPTGTQQVRVQMIGYGIETVDVTVAAGQVATANIELSETAVALDEIVVTGTAAASRRKEVGNSIAAISASDIATAPVANPQDVLAGRAAGVTIMTNSGQPGAGGTIKVRGVTTVSQSANPIIYVDGIRIFSEPTRNGWSARTMSNPLQDIAAEDIERIEVIKGAAATTLYGTDAAAGVIQVFTKKGLSGAPQWTAELTSGVSSSVHWGPKDDASNLFVSCDNNELMYGLDFDTGERVYFRDPTCPSDGSWTRLGYDQGLNLSVRGGSENVTYFVSGNFSNTDGILPGSNSKDGGIRGNFSFQPLDGLQVAINTSYTRRNVKWVGDGNNSNGFLLNVGRGWRGYYKGGQDLIADECAALPQDQNGNDIVCVTNGYMFDLVSETNSDHFITGVTLNYTPTGSLSNRLAVGYDYTGMGNPYTTPYGSLRYPLGRYWDEQSRYTMLSIDYAGSFQNSFTSDIASTFSWGGQIFRDNKRWTEFDSEDFAGPGRPTLESGALLTYLRDRPTSVTNAGFFFQEMIGWKDRLFVTGGLRVDGNSTFGEAFGLQPYPKVSVAYAISDHDFWPTDWFETLKLRAAVGESGKAPGPFDKFMTWTPISADEGQPGFTPNDLGNPDIGPERTREVELGFDASLFTGRLGVELTYYNAKTFDALVPVNYPPSNGFTAARLENVGSLRNTGLELMLNGGLIRTDNLEWRARLNMSLMKSEALDLGGEEIYTGLKSYIREGYTVPTYFGLVITNPDEVGAPVVVSDTAMGPVFPTKLFGVGTTLTLMNNLTIDALAEYQGGHYLNNYTGYQNARRGVWPDCYAAQEQMLAGDYSGLTAEEQLKCAIDSSENSDYWMEKADFLKIRYVSLTYNLPPGLFRFANGASVTLAGRNLWTWLPYYTGSDPEVMDASDQFNLVGNAGRLGRRDYYQIPSPRQFTASLRFSF